MIALVFGEDEVVSVGARPQVQRRRSEPDSQGEGEDGNYKLGQTETDGYL